MVKVLNRYLLALLLAAVLFPVVPASVFADHSWGNYHWARKANPFTVKLGNNVTNVWNPYLGTTSSDWSKSTVLETSIVAGGASSNVRRCRPTAGRVEVCNTAYGNNGWLGVASIWASGNHITQATVKVNDTYFNTATYNTPAWRNLVMCQEVGHTFGLDHQDETFNNFNLDTCMDYTSDPSSNQHPNVHDYDQLVTIYNHLDNTTTLSAETLAAQMPPAMRNIDISGPGQWGKLIHSSHGGWKETYELDFGGGHKIITHVLWATDEDDSDDHGHEQGRR
jgi:hypothetical protein